MFQHFGLFGGHFLAAAGAAGFGGAGRATWATGRGGGGGAGRATCGAGCGGGGGGGGGRRAGSTCATGGGGFAGAAAGFADGGGGRTSFGFRPISRVFGPPAAPAPDAGPAVAGVVVEDLLSGVSFALGLVTLGTGPVVAGVFGLPPAPVPDAGPAGDVVVGVVVADLFSGTSLAPGVVTPGTGPVVPEGKGEPPFIPGRVLSFDSALGDTFVCSVAGAPFWPVGATAVPGLAD